MSNVEFPAKLQGLASRDLAMAIRNPVADGNFSKENAKPDEKESDLSASFVTGGLDQNRFRSAWHSWLSLNDSWTSKWWYAAVHNVTAVIGAGVLSLHSSMVDLGWAPGTFLLILLGVLSLCTMWQMIELHEIQGQRLDRYHELGQKAFGKKLGLWIIVPMQMAVEIGVDTVYMLTAGKSILKVYSLLSSCSDDDCDLKLRYCIMAFASIQVVLSQLPNFTSITWVSIIAAGMSIGYSTIAWVGLLLKGRAKSVNYKYPHRSTAGTVFNVFSSLGQIAFAFAGHNITLEIQATMPSTPQKPSKISAWNGGLFAYLVVVLCYFPNALVGYYILGSDKQHNKHVLEILNEPKWLVAAGNLMIVVHMCGGFQIFAMPLFDKVETYLVRSWKFEEGVFLRSTVRLLYVAFTCFLAVTFPFFGDLQTVTSGIAFVPTTFLLPCIIWQRIRRPRKFGLHWLANWTSIVIGVCLTLVATIGGLRSIVIDASTYKFYS